MTRRYSIYDAAALGTDLDLDNGGVVLTTVTSGLDINRTARGNISQTDRDNVVEFIVYGDATTLDNKVSIGVCTASSSLSNYVGGQLSSIGYRLGEGDIYRNGVSIQSATVAEIGDVVTMLVSFGDETLTILWQLNGATVATVTLDTGSPADSLTGVPLYWAVSIGSTIAAGDIKVFVNSGRQDLEHPSALSDGWWTSTAIGDTIRISDVPYLSLPSDEPASARWHGVIDKADIQIDRGVHFWPWGDSQSTRGSGVAIVVSDPDGLLDETLTGALRDQPVTLSFLDSTGAALNDATSVGSFVLERVEATDEITRRITCRDTLASLEAPLQRRFIRPDAAEDAAFRPWPVTIGAVFSMEPVLIDELDYRYALDSVGLSTIGKVRDAGDPLESVGSPTTYYLENGGQTLRLATVPFGILTIDAEYTGSSYVYTDGSPPYDATLGFGNPFTEVGSPDEIAHWEEGGSFGDPANFPRFASPDRVGFPQIGSGYVSNIRFEPQQLQAGVQYQWSITVHQIQRYTSPISPAYIGLSSLNSEFGYFWRAQSTSVSGQIIESGTGATRTLPYTFTGLYTPAYSHDLYIHYVANNIVSGIDCEISGLTFIEVPQVDAEAEDSVVEEALLPLPLNLLLRELIEVRGRFSSTIWDQSSATAIDTATGYQGQGYHTREQVTVRDAVDSVLTGYTASVYLARDGRLKVMRLVAPENETATATLTSSDMTGPPLPTWDEARGLSRQLGVRRNERILTDTDLVTDEIEVTLRLRRKLARRHRFVCATGASLAAGLEHADAGEVVDTRLVKREDGQTEIDRVGGMYTDSRCFYNVPVVGRSDLDIGDVVNVTYPRFGLDDGKNLLLVRVRESRLADQQVLTFWGLAP
jgi:hypothetical protein